jgi:hypothetical protein
MKTSKLNVASISDIHLGAKRTPTRGILQNLRTAFPDNEETGALDLICFVGDVFDTLLSLNHDDLVEIDIWIAEFLRMCVRRNIKVYVLEGTPSHDWWQSERFVSINEEIGRIGANLRYVKDISVEYDPDLDIWVGFVPDESAPTTDQTLSQLKSLLQTKGLDKVDLMFMHGQFEYQLPPHITAQKHDSQAYLALTKYLIFIGHVHIHSSYERIFAQGSFDRLSHGEEEAKGHIRATLYADGTYEVTFVENEGAKKYVTVYTYGMSVEDALYEIERKVRNLPFDSAVRLEANHDHPLFADMDVLIREYPSFTWTKNPKERDKQEVEELIEDDTTYIAININSENITKLLMERLVIMGLDAELLAIAETKINEVK